MRQAFSYLLGFLAGLWEAEGAYIDPLGMPAPRTNVGAYIDPLG
jgi:hypothetical protein